MQFRPKTLLKLLSSFAGCLLALTAQAAEKPNIIFILGDDQAWWDYSFMYRANVEKAAVDMDSSIQQVAQTPEIDSLADDGLTFTHGYTVPLCRPSLQAIITGMLPHQNRVSGNDMEGKADDTAADEKILMNQSIARTLVKRFGYRAYQTGKWWGGHHTNGGFTEGDTVNTVANGTGPPQYTGSRPSYANRGRHGDWGLMIGRVDYTNDIQKHQGSLPFNYADTIVPMTDFIDSCVEGDDPFFIWYAPFLPHTPFDPPEALRAKYDPLVDEPNEASNQDFEAKYYANIERLDGGIGALLDHLDASGISDNTMIVFICDNGWITTATGGSTRSKRQPYDAGARTPIILRWPKMIKAGGAIEPQIVTQPVSVIDLVTTALAAVEAEPSPEQRGINLMDMDQVNARDAIYCDVYEHDMASLENPVESIVARFVVKDGWKLIDFDTGSDELYQLYNTSTGAPVDPFETDDKSSTDTAKVTELQGLIDTWYDEPKDNVWSDQAAQTLGTDGIAIPADLGQSFTVGTDSHLVGVNLPFQQVDAAQSISVELRELDGNGAPLGDLLASASLQPDPVYQAGFRWSLFLFDEPVAVTAGEQLGFLVKSQSQPNSGFQIAYNNAGGYTGGSMYFSGTIGGSAWDSAGLDLAFKVLGGNYDTDSQSVIFRSGDTLYVSGEMAVRGQPVEVQASTDLAVNNWSTVAMDDNLDGLVTMSEPLAPGKKFYRFGLSTVGSAFNVRTQETGTLYEELFDGSGINLNLQTPNITTDGAMWSAPAANVVQDNGDFAGTGGVSAYLPFTPQSGFIYTLEVEFDQGSETNDDWVTFGFVGESPSVGSHHSTNGNGIIWALTRNFLTNDNQVLHENAGGGSGAKERGNYVLGANPVSMKIVLDTTLGSGNWTYTWIVDGTVRGTENRTVSGSVEAAIGGIGISTRSGASSNSISYLRLTRE